MRAKPIRLWTMVAALSTAGVAGCGGPEASGQAPQGGADMAIGLYPTDHLGNQVGEVLEDFMRPGYRLSPSQRDPTRLPWDETISLADYHFNPACKCLLITVGTRTCTACASEQPFLAREVEKDPGFCVLSVLQEGLEAGSGKVTREDVDWWTGRYRQNFFVVQGGPATRNLWQGYGATIGLPFNVIAEPRSMRIKTVPVEGFRQDIHDYAMAACAR